MSRNDHLGLPAETHSCTIYHTRCRNILVSCRTSGHSSESERTLSVLEVDIHTIIPRTPSLVLVLHYGMQEGMPLPFPDRNGDGHCTFNSIPRAVSFRSTCMDMLEQRTAVCERAFLQRWTTMHLYPKRQSGLSGTKTGRSGCNSFAV